MNIARLRGQIKLDEGFRGEPYRCSAGKWTIGYGRNLSDNPLTTEEGEYLLTNDLKFAALDAVQMFARWDRLSDMRQEVLVNMMYNLGSTKLRKFKKMREALFREDYGRAADEMLDSTWAKQVGLRAERLAKQMRFDEEQEDG